MELKIEEYGHHLFQTMTSEKGSQGEHWESIRSKAEPLVRELIRLNSEMKGGGYKIVGYIDDNGKEKLSDCDRIYMAQEKLWLVPTNQLKEGDKIWLRDGDLEMYIQDTRPGVVEEVTSKAVYVELYDWEEYTQKIAKGKDYFVFKAPKDWNDKEDIYTSDEYWLEQADKLGI